MHIDWRVLLLAFSTLFIAEMGDKTQMAVFTLVTDTKNPLSVFLGASVALAFVTLIGVDLGGLVAKYVPPHYLRIGAGFLFVGIGFYTLWETFSEVLIR